MPRVPVNTVSSVPSARLPDVRNVQLRGAEGLGALAAASARGASIVGGAIDDTRRQFASRARLIDAEARTAISEANALISIGSDITRLGVHVNEALKRRDRQAVDEALARARKQMTDATTGTTDADGQVKLGTYAAPYSPPGREGQPASGASVATSKWLGEWSNDPEHPAASLSPRQRAMYDTAFSEIADTYQRRAFEIDVQNHARHVQAADAAADAEALRHLGTLAGDANPAAWMDATVLSAREHAARKHRIGLKNPLEMNPTKIEWKTPEDERLAAQHEADFLAEATSNRAAVLIEKAVNAPLDSELESELYLAHALDAATWQANGKPVLAAGQSEAIVENIDRARQERKRRAAAQEHEAFNEARRIGTALAIGAIPFNEENNTRLHDQLNRLPPERSGILMRDLEEAMAASEVSNFEAMLDDNRAGGQTSNEQLRAMIPLMKSKRAQTQATLLLNSQETAQTKAWQEEQFNQLAPAFVAGGYLGADRKLHPTGDDVLLRDAVSHYYQRNINRDQYDKLLKILRERKDDKDLYQNAVDAASRVLGGDVVGGAFKFTAGRVELSAKAPDAFDVKLSDTWQEPSRRWTADGRLKPPREKSKSRKVQLQAHIVAQAIQLYVDYMTAPRMKGTPPPSPEDAEAYLKQFFSFENHPGRQELTALQVEAEINTQRGIVEALETHFRQAESRAQYGINPFTEQK